MAAPPLHYRLIALLARAILPAVGLSRPRVRLMLRERREARARFRAFARERKRETTTILFHASSAGELRQLEPVLRRLQAIHPDWQMVVTWFSTSGAPVARAFPAAAAGALPWDTPWATGRFLDQLRPAVIVIGKADLWPELAWQAERRRIPVVLLAATVRPGSGRLRWPAVGILQRAYGALTAVGAVDRDDIDTLVALGVDRSRITISGDPRHDSVLDRLQHAPAERNDPALLVAGSTWPADDLVLLTAFAELRGRYPQARLLLIPHRPDQASRRRIDELAPLLGLVSPVTLAASVPEDNLLIEPRVGQLALQYQLGGIAYVGGGFGTAGLHSVLEPAATGVPVIVGPHWEENRDAVALHDAGALKPLNASDHVEQLIEIWSAWLENGDARKQAGMAGQRVVRDGTGAAERSVEIIEWLLAPSKPDGG